MWRAYLKLSVLLVPVVCARVLAGQSGPGQQIFSSTCAGCHGLDGKGGEHAPDIATSERIQRLADADLRNIIRNGIIKGGMPAFGATLNDTQQEAVVTYLRFLQGKRTATLATGDAAAGRRLFFGRARCSNCHMVAGEGGFIAADLSGYGATHRPDEIRDRILNPQKSLKPGRELVKIETKGGESFTGVTRNEDNFSLQLQTLDGRFVFLDKAEISRSAAVPEGLMPRDYGSTLSTADIDNLVSYLVNAAGRP